MGLLLACRSVFNVDDYTKVITKQLKSDCTLFHCEVFIPYICRETLLGQLTVHHKQIQEQFTQATNGKYPKGKNLPEFVNLIVFIRQLEAKVSDLTNVLEIKLDHKFKHHLISYLFCVYL